MRVWLLRPATQDGLARAFLGEDGPQGGEVTVDDVKKAVAATVAKGVRQVVLQADGEVPHGEVIRVATVMTEVGQPELGATLRDQYEEQGRPWYSSARLWDDGVIDPRETRDVLAQALDACTQAPLADVANGIFRM